MPLGPIGKVLAIAIRSVHLRAMIEVAEAWACRDDCLKGDHGSTRRRGLTLLASSQWQQVTRELGVDLPWHTRRANVLVETDMLASLIGHTIRVGQVRVRIHGETTPCDEMDQLHSGLKAILTPDCRGGIYGHILDNGRIRVGDMVRQEG